MTAPKTDLKTTINNKLKQAKARNAVWSCSCGYKIPKKNAPLSGDPSYKQGFHVHCPNCGRTIAQFVNPKEPQ